MQRQPEPDYQRAAEEWNATPTPVYDAFNVDWTTLYKGGRPVEAQRIEDMWSSQMDALRRTYPAFDFTKVKWPVTNGMELPSAVGQKLASFMNAEKWALSGFESPAHMLGADNESRRRAAAQAAALRARVDRRGRELAGLFGGRNRKTRKARKGITRSKKIKTRGRK